MLMLLATQTISKATASTQKACRTCSSLPANCTIDINNNINTVVNCHVNFSSCPIKNCTDKNQKFCSYRFDSFSNSTIFDLTILDWVFSSDCFTTEVVPNRCTFTNKGTFTNKDTFFHCLDGVSSENGSNLEVVEYQTKFNLPLPTERE